MNIIISFSLSSLEFIRIDFILYNRGCEIAEKRNLGFDLKVTCNEKFQNFENMEISMYKRDTQNIKSHRVS